MIDIEIVVMLHLLVAGFIIPAFESHTRKSGIHFHPFLVFIAGMLWPVFIVGAVVSHIKSS